MSSQSTADRVLALLQQLGFKAQPNGEYRGDNPFRAGSDSNAFCVKITGPEHGTYKDHTGNEQGSLYDLANKLADHLNRSDLRPDKTAITKLAEDPQTYPDRHGCTWADYACWGAKLQRFTDYTHDKPGSGKVFDAVYFPDSTGGHFRLFGHPKAKFMPAGTKQESVLYGLTEAVQLANATKQDALYLVNGQPSVIACYAHGVPAFTVPGGEGNIKGRLEKGLVIILKAVWNGRVLVVLDGDSTGKRSAPGVVDVLRANGFDAEARDPGKDLDAAELCVLHNGSSVQAFQNLPMFHPPPPQPLGATSNTHGKLDRDTVLMYLDQEEAGDSQLLHALFQGQLVYDYAAKQWYEFVAYAWKALYMPPWRLVSSAVASAYLKLAAELQAETATATSAQRAKLMAQVDALTARARKLCYLKRMTNTLTLAQELLGVSGEMWDADPWLLGVANGVIDLRTGQLRDGRPDDYIRTVAPTFWEGLTAPCSRWERFVSEIMSNETDRVAFLQRLLGYALNGTTKEHMLAVFVGEEGRNGKRVLFEQLQRILGPYAHAVSTDVLIGQDHNRTAGTAQPHLADLRGKRIAYCSETKERDKLNTAQVKAVTGGDLITARRLHENLISFMPTHTLFLQTNRKPQAPADDAALWERVKVLEFKERFVDDPNGKKPHEHARDLTLEEVLNTEAAGILAWLVLGHLEWLKNGLRPPQGVRMARDIYRHEESIDDFLAACCSQAKEANAEGGALYAAYKAWCAVEHLRAKSNNWFAEQLRPRFEKGRTIGGRTCYYGVCVTYDLPKAEDLKIYQGKSSEGIRMLYSNVGEDDCTQFPEDLESIPMSFEEKATHEEKNMDRSSGSSGSSDDDLPVGIGEADTDPLAAVNWPSVRIYINSDNLDQLRAMCSGLWRVDYDQVVTEARRRWPDLFYKHKLIPLKDGTTLYELVLTDEWQDVPDGWGVPAADIRLSPFTGMRRARKFQIDS